MIATRKKENDFVMNRVLGKKVTIFEPRSFLNKNKNLEIMSITIDEYYTRIDFKYTASSKYTNGGWVTIHKDTYIQPHGTEIKYSLLKTGNIPLAPMKHYFESCGEVLFYTLYFPPLSWKIDKINIVEAIDAENPFNFEGVFLKKGKRNYNFDFSDN